MDRWWVSSRTGDSSVVGPIGGPRPKEDTMARTTLHRVAVAAALTGALAVGAAPVGLAKAPVSKASGTCSKGAVWTLKAKADAGRVEVELEVDSNRAGQTWLWTMHDNGVRVGSALGRTVAPSGSFTARRLVANRAGTDTITVSASHAATGQTCSARVVFRG